MLLSLLFHFTSLSERSVLIICCTVNVILYERISIASRRFKDDVFHNLYLQMQNMKLYWYRHQKPENCMETDFNFRSEIALVKEACIISVQGYNADEHCTTFTDAGTPTVSILYHLL